jgi:hypothetical protein
MSSHTQEATQLLDLGQLLLHIISNKGLTYSVMFNT